MITTLKGRWAGEYIYGSGYGSELEGQKEEFVAYVENVVEDKISGTVTDKDQHGEFHEACLEGFLDNNFISFIKKYNKSRYFDDNLDSVVEEGNGGYQVIYEGTFNEVKMQFEGEWEIRVDVTPLSIDKTIEEFSEGTWWMKKID
jgi:hypothetical protein